MEIASLPLRQALCPIAMTVSIGETWSNQGGIAILKAEYWKTATYSPFLTFDKSFFNCTLRFLQ